MSNGSETFRRLVDDKWAAGYRVICDSVAWQDAKGIRLWERPLPREIYARRQTRGENYWLLVDGALAAVVSLISEIPDYWAEHVTMPRATWLCTLATAADFHGRGAGRRTVEAALAHLARAERTWVYLDAAEGFLERFYASLGFEAVQRQNKHIPHGPCRAIECVLMRKQG